ncbi:MAG: acetylglutamate kinase [Bacteroidota bacterium]
MDRITIVKVGGKVVEDSELLQHLLKQFTTISSHKIFIHGGGSTATKMATKLGLASKMIDGRRITDEQMLEVITMVYGGLINKQIVARLQALGCNALGLTGVDLNLVSAVKRPAGEIDYGFVGDVDDVNSREIRMLINENVVPVVAPVTHDGKGSLLNTNADTIASEIAIELSSYFETRLIFCMDKTGVLLDPEDESSIIYELAPELYRKYKQTGIISSGMIPKLDNGFHAKRNGVHEVVITNAQNIASGKGTRLA